MLQEFQHHIRAAKGDRQVAGQETPGVRAKGQRAQRLRQAQIDFSRPIDSVERLAEQAVGAQHLVAVEYFFGIFYIVQFEIVARDGVAQVSHVQKSAFDNQIEQLFDQLAARDHFRRIGAA